MKNSLEIDLNATITHDDDGTVRAITFTDYASAIPGTSSAKPYTHRPTGEIDTELTALCKLDRNASYIELRKSPPSIHADRKRFFNTASQLNNRGSHCNSLWGYVRPTDLTTKQTPEISRPSIRPKNIAPPHLVSAIADNGDFGNTCIGDFTDRMLTLSNSGQCLLTLQKITSSITEFAIPSMQNFPVTIGAGHSLQIPIRFQPSSFGTSVGTLTIDSDDPLGNKTIRVIGTVPSGRLSITGSTCIGGVNACCIGEQKLTLANVGHCPLDVFHVDLVRSSKYWMLANNPFPATIQPGESLNLLIRYKAEERSPRPQELVIKTDDPESPKLTLDLLAYTVWEKGPE